MHGAGGELLAGAGLALEQDGDVGGGGQLEHGEDLAHDQAGADQLAEAVGAAGLDLQLVRLGLDPQGGAADPEGGAGGDLQGAEPGALVERAVGAAEVLDQELAARLGADAQVLARGTGLRLEEDTPVVGGPRSFQVHKFPVRDDHGRVHAVGAISVDVTDLKAARSAAEAAAEAKSQFLARIRELRPDDDARLRVRVEDLAPLDVAVDLSELAATVTVAGRAVRCTSTTSALVVLVNANRPAKAISTAKRPVRNQIVVMNRSYSKSLDLDNRDYY